SSIDGVDSLLTRSSSVALADRVPDLVTLTPGAPLVGGSRRVSQEEGGACKQRLLWLGSWVGRARSCAVRAAHRSRCERRLRRAPAARSAAGEHADPPRWSESGGRTVFVMAPDPQRLARALVAPLRRAIEQAVVGHRDLEAA